MKQVFIYKNGVWDDVCNCNVKTYFQGSWVDIDYNNVDKYTKLTENNSLVDLDCKNGKYIKWGYVYNFYAQQDARNIANPTNGWRLPNDSDISFWKNSIDMNTVRATGFYDKGQSFTFRTGYFYYNNLSFKIATNTSNMSILPRIGISINQDSIGSTIFINGVGYWMLPTNERIYDNNANSEYQCFYDSAWNLGTVSGLDKPYKSFQIDSKFLKIFDYSHLRLCRDLLPSETALADGTYVNDYIGNDGKSYKAVKFQNRVWMAEYLCETKYANNDVIVVLTTKNQIETTPWINTNNIGLNKNLWSKNPYCVQNWFSIYNSEYTAPINDPLFKGWFTNDIKFNIE